MMQQDPHSQQALGEGPVTGHECTAERVGPLELRVEATGATAETAQRWEQRVEALVAWLLAEWERERRKEAA